MTDQEEQMAYSIMLRIVANNDVQIKRAHDCIRMSVSGASWLVVTPAQLSYGGGRGRKRKLELIARSANHDGHLCAIDDTSRFFVEDEKSVVHVMDYSKVAELTRHFEQHGSLTEFPIRYEY